MDAHFERVFGSDEDNKAGGPYIASAAFGGRRDGYYFTRGSKGLGYYLDSYQANLARKRKRDDSSEDNGHQLVTNDETRDANATSSSSQQSVERLLEEADAVDIAQLDTSSLKQLLLNFEKKITKNQRLRMKYPDEPEKFMESELELHAEIQELFAVAASPELYPVVAQTGAVNSLLGMLTHENNDISITTLSLLQELTDADAIEEELDAAMTLIDSFLSNQGLELVVQNLSRLDESNDEDAQGVSSSLGIIENIVEAKPEVAITVCEKTHILQFLLQRLQHKEFDANKLNCSEVLGLLLQADAVNQQRICSIDGLDGMESLLQCIALYRKRLVTASDEQELVENLFLCLGAVLQLPQNQQKFIECEGFELLLRCLREHQYAASCCISAIECAIARNVSSCERLVDIGGLKFVFPLLTSGGVKQLLASNSADNTRSSSSSNAGKEKRQQIEESAIVIVAQLVAALGSSQRNDYPARILLKLTEREHEKLERCVELYLKFARRFTRTDREIQATIAALQQAEDDEALDEFTAPDSIYAERLKGGLFYMQQLAVIITFACVFDSQQAQQVSASLRKTAARLAAEDVSLDMLLEVLRDYLAVMREKYEEAEDIDSSSSGSSNGSSSNNSESSDQLHHTNSKAEKQIIFQQMQILTQWSAAFAEQTRNFES